MSLIKTLLLACSLLALPSLSFAADAGLSDAQKKEVESVVRDLLTKKEPEIIIKAAQVIQEKMETETANKGKEAVKKNLDKITNDPTSPVGGNPKGDVTVVEFFDYACGYCKMAQETVEKLLSDDKNIRFVYKELPILGPKSEMASRAALASVSQGKYEKFHTEMMTSKDSLTEETILSIAKRIGLDTDKLKKEMGSDKVDDIIKANIALAKEIGASGTPTFVIGDKVHGGAIPLEQMKEAIAVVRSGKKK